MAVQACLCLTRSETPKTGFLVTRIVCCFEFIASFRHKLMRIDLCIMHTHLLNVFSLFYFSRFSCQTVFKVKMTEILLIKAEILLIGCLGICEEHVLLLHFVQIFWIFMVFPFASFTWCHGLTMMYPTASLFQKNRSGGYLMITEG